MRMILEVFYSKPPAHHREILIRKESDSLKDLIALGESRQSDAESIYYHVLFQDNTPGKEAFRETV